MILTTHDPANLYTGHLQALTERTAAALQRGGFDHLVIPAGLPATLFLDDRECYFHVNPHFKHWLPVTQAPGSWLVITPGKKPKLIFLQPHDYWHVVPDAPSGYWVEHFDIAVIRKAGEAAALLPASSARCAIIGEAGWGLEGHVPNNPSEVIEYLHYQRSYKTAYELSLMRVASKLGARGHIAAERAFREGKSEFGIHMDYLRAVGQNDNQLPYTNIIGLNEHGAVLHYMETRTQAPAESHSLLIDAGASWQGYASDITRSHAVAHADDFKELIAAVEDAELGFCAMVRPGQSYADLHVHAHHVLAGVLNDFGFITMSPESAVESGVTATFFPHGLGHPIGLQVHDVAGFHANDRGDTIPRPPGHPYLRFTRKLEAGMVCTIEPGVYFIDMLLAELKGKPQGRDVDWDLVDSFRKYGGVRIEDDVVCTNGEPENLTRNAFAALGAGTD
ncbi:MAG: Xaa-Pro dipeptidase [Dokdonella sp.]